MEHSVEQMFHGQPLLSQRRKRRCEYEREEYSVSHLLYQFNVLKALFMAAKSSFIEIFTLLAASAIAPRSSQWRIERSVKQDGAHAISREVQFKDKRLYYGFYELPDRDGSNRYLFYLNQLAAGGNKVIVIYMEGSASLEQVKKMLK